MTTMKNHAAPFVLLASIALSSQASELRELPLVPSARLISECGVTLSHFYTLPGPAEDRGCAHLTRDSLIEGGNANFDRLTRLRSLYEPLRLPGGETLISAPHGLIFKDRLKISIGEASIVSPVSADLLLRAFGGSVKIHSVLHYPHAKAPSHYLLSVHEATLVYDRSARRFCPRYIPSDAPRFFQHPAKGLVLALSGGRGSASSNDIQTYPIDLNELCK